MKPWVKITAFPVLKHCYVSELNLAPTSYVFIFTVGSGLLVFYLGLGLYSRVRIDLSKFSIKFVLASWHNMRALLLFHSLEGECYLRTERSGSEQFTRTHL